MDSYQLLLATAVLGAVGSLAFGPPEPTVEVLNAERVEFHASAPWSRAGFWLDERELVTVGNASMNAWNLSTGRRRTSKFKAPQGVPLLAVSENGKFAVFASGGPIYLWDARFGRKERVEFDGHEKELRALALSPDGKRLGSLGQIEKFRQPVGVKIWDTASGDNLATLYHLGKSEIRSFAFAPDGSLVATVGYLEDPQAPPQLTLWDASTAKPVKQFSVVGDAVKEKAVEKKPKEKLPKKNLPKDEDEDEPTRPTVRRRTSDGDLRVAFSPGGGYVYVTRSASPRQASDDPLVLIWDVATGKQVFAKRPVAPPKDARSPHPLVGVCNLSPKDTHFATLYSGNLITLGTTAGFKKSRTLSGHEAPVTWVEFSPDGQHLASASIDWTIRIWSVPEGKLLTTLTGHRQAVRALRFSPKGQSS